MSLSFILKKYKKKRVFKMKAPIILCENISTQLKSLTQTVKDFITFHPQQFKLVLTTYDPYEVENYVCSHKLQKGIYLLDIDLNAAINGST